MGSKDLFDDEDYRQHEVPRYDPEPHVLNGEQRGCHISRDGDGCIGTNGSTGQEDDDGGDNDDDDDDDASRAAASSLNDTEALDLNNKKKKRKRSKKKKSSASKQSVPPRIPLHDLFPSGQYPPGELLDYPSIAQNKLVEQRHEARRDLEESGFLNDYRKAAEIHRQVRRWVKQSVKPGQSLTELANGIEDSVRALLDNAGLEPGDSLKSGMGFPTSLSVNNCVAHYTPNPDQKDIILQQGDVTKVDFGVHTNGWIVDSAFTLAFDPTYDNLLAAVKDATNTGIKNAGIDVRISDVSAAIQEVMESYEVEIGGKTYPVKPVKNLCGHDIQHYRIHGRKMIPFIKNSDQTKMEQGEIFAIETFGSTGRGFTRDAPGVYGYGLAKNAPKRVNMPLASANRIYKTVRENFGSIVFCRRYLARLGVERYVAGLNCLVDHGVLEDYAPLVDSPGSYSAQFEHTILLRESTKEVISRGSDY